MLKTVTATEAVWKFSEILNSVNYRGDRYEIIRGGKPVASICPVEKHNKECVLADLRELQKKLPRLGDEAEKFEMDLKGIARRQPVMPETNRLGLIIDTGVLISIERNSLNIEKLIEGRETLKR